MTTKTAPERRRVTTKGEATRESIKLAAKRAIAVDGFAAVKIADIMAEAGRSPGAFYLYFKSKEVLLHELLEDFRLRLKAEVNKPLDAGEGPRESLVSRISAFWSIYREDWPVATAAFQMSMVNHEFSRAWRNVRRQGMRGTASFVRLVQKEGYSPGLDPELVASALSSMLEYTCYNWTVRGGDFPDRFIDDKTATNVLTHLILNAVGGQTQSDTSHGDFVRTAIEPHRPANAVKR